MSGRFFNLMNFILRTLDWQIPKGSFDYSFLGQVYGLLEPVGFCDLVNQQVVVTGSACVYRLSNAWTQNTFQNDHTLLTPWWDRNQWGGGEDTRENIQGGATPTPRGPAPLHTYTHARGGRCQLPLMMQYMDQECSLQFLHDSERVHVATVSSISR